LLESAVRLLGHSSAAFLAEAGGKIDGLTQAVREKRLRRRVDGHFEGVAR
jgi:hypothetical protein